MLNRIQRKSLELAKAAGRPIAPSHRTCSTQLSDVGLGQAGGWSIPRSVQKRPLR